VSRVSNMSNLFDNTAINNTNYNNILTGWTGWDGTGATKSVQSNVTLGAVGRQYTNSGNVLSARTYLDITKNWTINGDVPV
jgi:hypothetical protein